MEPNASDKTVSDVWDIAPSLRHISWYSYMSWDSSRYFDRHLGGSLSLDSVTNVFPLCTLTRTHIHTRLRHVEITGDSTPQVWNVSWPVLNTLVLRNVVIVIGKERRTFLTHQAPSLVILKMVGCSFEVETTEDDTEDVIPKDRVFEWVPPPSLRSLHVECNQSPFDEDKYRLRLQLQFPSVLPLTFLRTRLSSLDHAYYLPATLTDLYLELDQPITHVFGRLPCLLRLRLDDRVSDIYPYYGDECEGTPCHHRSRRPDLSGCVASPYMRECHLSLSRRSTLNAVVDALLERTHPPCVIVVPRFRDFDVMVEEERETSLPYGSLYFPFFSTYKLILSRREDTRWCHYEERESPLAHVDYVWTHTTDIPPSHVHTHLPTSRRGNAVCTFHSTTTLSTPLYSLFRRGYTLVTRLDAIQKACPTNGVNCLCTLTASFSSASSSSSSSYTLDNR